MVKRRKAKKPWLSIIVPTLNEEKRIDAILKYLKSIAPNAELIVADGRSTDHTREIAARYADKVVCQVHEGERKTIGAGRNAGARVASAPILLFNDADTRPSKKYLQKIRAAFEDESVVCAGCLVMPDDKGIMTKLVFGFFNFLIHASVALGRGTISGNSVAYRASAFKSVGGFDEEMAASEDQDLCARINRIGKVRFFNDVVAYTSSRRLKKMGWFGLFLDWGGTTLNFLLGRKNKRYAIVREI